MSERAPLWVCFLCVLFFLKRARPHRQTVGFLVGGAYPTGVCRVAGKCECVCVPVCVAKSGGRAQIFSDQIQYGVRIVTTKILIRMGQGGRRDHGGRTERSEENQLRCIFFRQLGIIPCDS